MNRLNKSHSKEIKITTYNENYQKDFANLNLEWIEEYFAIEQMDRKYLYNPVENIIKKGGEIFFIVEQEKVKGTCAVIKHSSDVYEIGKMAVIKSSRGKGFGKLLLETAINSRTSKSSK